MDIGEALKRSRRRRGMSQRDLSRESGIEQSVISRIERGDICPLETTVISLSRALGDPSVLIARMRPMMDEAARMIGVTWRRRDDLPVRLLRQVRDKIDALEGALEDAAQATGEELPVAQARVRDLTADVSDLMALIELAV